MIMETNNIKYALTLREISNDAFVRIPIREINNWYVGNINPLTFYKNVLKEFFKKELEPIKESNYYNSTIDILIANEVNIYSDFFGYYNSRLIYKNEFLFLNPEPYNGSQSDFMLKYDETLLSYL